MQFCIGKSDAIYTIDVVIANEAWRVLSQCTPSGPKVWHTPLDANSSTRGQVNGNTLHRLTSSHWHGLQNMHILVKNQEVTLSEANTATTIYSKL